MKIGIQTWGSEGDVRPFLALAGGLAKAGHEVILSISDVSGLEYGSYADPLGIQIRTVDGRPPGTDMELYNLAQEVLKTSPAKQLRLQIEELLLPIVPRLFKASRELCEECDIVVGHTAVFPLRLAAEAAGVPEVSVLLAAHTLPGESAQPTGSLENVGLLKKLGLWLRHIQGVRNTRKITKTLLGKINELRWRSGLPGLQNLDRAFRSPLLNLIAVSPTLVQPSVPWSLHDRICGLWNLAEDESLDELPVEVEAFLRAGDPPVCIAFGTLALQTPKERQRLVEIVEAALRIAGLRGIVQRLAPPEASNDSVLHVGRLPHLKTFPRCAAVVSHGGPGTIHTALISHAPCVIVPHGADQFWWGRILHKAGVAAEPIPFATLEPGLLAERIRAALQPEVMARAAEVGEKIRNEDGVSTAVRMIEEVYHHPQRAADGLLDLYTPGA